MHKPNVILISIDTLRADHLSCYGYHRQTSPSIDRIVEEGTLFENAYSTAAWTPPAHASMFTGLYPSQHGVVNENRLNQSVPTIAEILQQNGYCTGGFVNNSQVGALVGLDRGHQRFDEVWKGIPKRHVLKRTVHKLCSSLGYSDKGAAETNQRALTWIQRGARRPFYLFIHYIETHNPLRPPRGFRFKYLDERLRRSVDMRKVWRVAHNPLICFTDDLTLTDQEKEALSCLYDEEIAYLDSRIGELLTELRKGGWLDDTMLVITADHGEHLGERDLYSHAASLYEPIVHIPLLIRYPQRFQAGRREKAIVQLTDILPTILDVTKTNFEDASRLPGKSLASIFAGQERHGIAEWEGRLPSFVRVRAREVHPSLPDSFFTQRITMIREGSFKYIIRSTGNEELYEVTCDSAEQTDILEAKTIVGIPLRQKLDNILATISRDVETERYEMSEDVKRNLEALGYM